MTIQLGAIPVHLFCGAWGTIAVGLFSQKVSIVAVSTKYHY
ncbi:hypothetical protein [Fischerella sp. JS2]